MLTTHPSSASDERGATMIVMALFLTVMLGMSALVVDIGAARHAKRKAQNLSDSASLAAAQELGDATQTPAQRMADATLQVTTYVQRQQPTPPSGFASWNAAWTACTDPGHLEVVSGAGSCISFGGPDPLTTSDPPVSATEAPAKVRVRVPASTVQPYFTKAVGAPDIQVAAASTAAIASSTGSFQGRLVLPIAHGPDTDTPWTRRRFRLRRSSPPLSRPLIYDDSNLNTWDRSCRKVDSSSSAACVFQSPRLTSFTGEVGTSAPAALRVNMAMGLDHELGTYPPGAPFAGPPTRVCDLNAPATSAPSPCSTTNVASASPANHVIMAQGRRWNWGWSLLCLFGCWQSEDLPSMDDWRSAVDDSLALGTLPTSNSNNTGYFRLGTTDFCARLARPALTEGNYNFGRPGGTCAPDSPTTQLQVNCGLFCTRTRTINGRHIGFYLTPAARTHFFGAPGGSGNGCGTNPTDPVPATDNVDSSRWNGNIETRLGWYFAQSETFAYPCANPPAAPIFEETITRDPRFAWIAIVQSDCEGNGNWNAGWWNWSFRGGGFTWDRSEGRCAAGTPKFVQEYRAIYIDTIEIDCCTGTDRHIDRVYAWEFDPALIEPWTSIGPTPTGAYIAYQGGPAAPVLEN